MTKAELLAWLRGQYQQWEALLDEVGLTRMDQAGVNGDWSMKDMVAHLTGWNRRLVAQLQAAGRGEPEPPSPWPANLQTDDEVNTWIYESNHESSVQEVLDDSRQMFQELFALVESLPEDIQIEIVRNSAGREFYPIWLGGQRYPVGEFFDHFRDDHEPDIRAWLAREKKYSGETHAH